jgi:hypothetical protein
MHVAFLGVMHRARFSFLLLVAACGGSTTQQRPWDRGPRASEHLEQAREHAELAAQHRASPETRPGAPGTPELSAGPPWYYYWSSAAEHDRLAQMHRTDAARIYAEYEAACGARPVEEVSVSPLQRWVTGGGEVPGGAYFVLDSAAGPPERLLGEMRCHRAWMMLGRSPMDDCPLDVAGVDVVAHEVDGVVEVLITTRDQAAVAELQRRAAHEIEGGAAARLRASPTPR